METVKSESFWDDLRRESLRRERRTEGCLYLEVFPDGYERIKEIHATVQAKRLKRLKDAVVEKLVEEYGAPNREESNAQALNKFDLKTLQRLQKMNTAKHIHEEMCDCGEKFHFAPVHRKELERLLNIMGPALRNSITRPAGPCPAGPESCPTGPRSLPLGSHRGCTRRVCLLYLVVRDPQTTLVQEHAESPPRVA